MSSDARHWTVSAYPHPPGQPASAVWLTPTALALGALPAEAPEGSGAGTPTQEIPFAALVLVQGDEAARQLTVKHQAAPGQAGDLRLAFREPAERDEALAALAARLGPTWEQERRRASRWPAAGAPLFLTAIVGLMTWICHSEAVALAAGKSVRIRGRDFSGWAFNAVLQLLEHVLGPRGVLVVGGLLLIPCLWWLYAVVARPPVQITLRRRGAF